MKGTDMLNWTNSPIITLFMACVVPTISFASVNTKFFTTRQIINSIALMALLGVILGGAAEIIINWAAADYNILSPAQWAAVTASVSGLAVYFVLSERMFSELLPKKRMRYAAMLIIYIAAQSLALIFSLAVVNGILTALLAFSIFDLAKNFKVHKEIQISEASSPVNILNEVARANKFKKTPNVYLLFLESMHSPIAAEMLYGIKKNDNMDEFWRDNKFTHYDNIFSNAAYTVASIAALLENNINHNPIGTLFSIPRVIKEFKSNGYKVNFFDNWQFAFLKYAGCADYCSFFIPRWVKKLYSICGPVFSQSACLRKIVKDVDIFRVDINFDAIYEEVRRKILKSSPETPEFSVIRFGAQHRSMKNTSEEWARIYPDLYAESLENIRKMVKMILAHDPEAVIIATGDHGARKHLEVWRDGDANERIIEQGLSPELAARDMCDVLLAVRWPAEVADPPALYSHINIFSHLFAILADDRQYLEDLHPDTCFGLEWWLVAKKGKILTRFSPFQGEMLEESIQTAEQRVVDNPDNVENHINLGKLLMRKNPLRAEQVLSAAHKLFADNLEVKQLLADCCLQNNNAVAAGSLYAHLCKERPDAKFFLGRAEALKIQGRTGEAKNMLLEGIATVRQGGRMLQDALLKHYLYLGDLAEGVSYYERNCAFEGRDDLPCAFTYTRLLAAQGKVDAALAYREYICPRPDSHRLLDGWEHYRESRNYHYDMIIFHILNKNWAKAAEWAKLCQGLFDGYPAWLYMLEYYCYEKQGKTDLVKELLSEQIRSGKNIELFGEYFGLFAIRNNIVDSAFIPLKRFALENIANKAKALDKYGLIDAEWYKREYMSGQSARSQKELAMHPAMHYQYYGVFEGADLNRYFNSLYYIRASGYVMSTGINPLMHFIMQGNQEMMDPSPRFSMKQYLFAHPELKNKGENALVHFMKNGRGIRGADRPMVEFDQAI